MGEHSEVDSDVIRIAVVLNGGVSLAVWMGGVTHEVNRLLNRPADDDTSSTWQSILSAPSQQDGEDRRRRVVVDYVAGTSAGGLNGSILAAAIARRAPLVKLKDLWMESARLTESKLLLGPGQPSAGTALLDGDFFEDEIGRVLGSIKPAAAEGTEEPTHGATEPTDVNEVTLLVTATALTAPRLRVRDAYKHRFNVSDRRRVYKFESNSRAANGADTFDNDVLKVAARASASFPAAFEPVKETSELRERRVDRWAELTKSRPASKPGTTWLIDGGVLDNAPFEPLLDEMRRNPRADHGERWVVYVVPSSPGLAGTTATIESPPETPTEAPPWFQVLKRLWGIKGETDLRADVEAILRLQEEARSTHQSPERLISRPALLSRAQAEQLRPTYQLTRAKGFVQFFRRATAGSEKLEVVRFEKKELDDLLAGPAPFVPVELEPRRNGSWQWGTTVARRFALWMSRDVRRRHADLDAVKKLAQAETDLEVLHRRMVDLFVGSTDLLQSTPAEALRQRAAEISDIQNEIWPVIKDAVATWAGTFETALSDSEAWSRLLTTEVLLNFAQWHGEANFPEFDVVLVDTGSPKVPDLVAENHPDLREKLRRRPDDKLYGTSLGHFGAFGREANRAHDWTWGRLDGAVCLANALLKDVDGTAATLLMESLVQEILLDEGLASKDSDALETLRANTREAFETSASSLLIDSINSGEIEIGPAVDAIEGAIDRLAADTPIGPTIDLVTDGVGNTVRAADGIRRAVKRMHEGLQSATAKVARIVGKLWP